MVELDRLEAETLHFGKTSCWRPSEFNSHFRLKSKASGWSTPLGVSMALDVADAQLGLVSVLSPVLCKACRSSVFVADWNCRILQFSRPSSSVMVPSTDWNVLVFGERTLFGWWCSFSVFSKQIVADAISDV